MTENYYQQKYILDYTFLINFITKIIDVIVKVKSVDKNYSECLFTSWFLKRPHIHSSRFQGKHVYLALSLSSFQLFKGINLLKPFPEQPSHIALRSCWKDLFAATLPFISTHLSIAVKNLLLYLALYIFLAR